MVAHLNLTVTLPRHQLISLCGRTCYLSRRQLSGCPVDPSSAPSRHQVDPPKYRNPLNVYTKSTNLNIEVYIEIEVNSLPMYEIHVKSACDFALISTLILTSVGMLTRTRGYQFTLGALP